MIVVYEVLTLVVVGVAMALSLAHALEWPGKRRLERENYLAAQTIYYPGFTIGGVSEPLGTVMLVVLAVLAPFGSVGFWLVAIAALCIVAMHVVLWVVTQPINKYWVKDLPMGQSGKAFFGKDATGDTPDWTALRDRWELSHAVRAVLAGLAFVFLATAVAL